MPNAQEKFVAARRILKKGDDVYIGVHKEFFFKSNTAAADFNKRINRNGCHLPYPSASRTPPCLSASLWTFVQLVLTACGAVRSESESGQMHPFLYFLVQQAISFSSKCTAKIPSPFPVRGSILITFNLRERTQPNAQEKFVAMFSTLSYFAFHACSKFQDISINFCAKSRERRCHKK